MTTELQTFIRVLPTRWRQKPAGIDMERNYVTATLCIPHNASAARAVHPGPDLQNILRFVIRLS